MFCICALDVCVDGWEYGRDLGLSHQPSPWEGRLCLSHQPSPASAHSQFIFGKACDHRRLAGTGVDDRDDGAGHGYECEPPFEFTDGGILGHSLTLHFVANDIIMAFFFGLATKEVQ